LAICGVSASGGRSLGGGTRRGPACGFARPQPPFLLLLDEPTNHLDLAAIEKRENVLKGFDGALIVVSHDEAILRTIGSSRKIALVWAMYL
jgi:ATPase subunit of ABC transporter with duplicated ATPase domains